MHKLILLLIVILSLSGLLHAVDAKPSTETQNASAPLNILNLGDSLKLDKYEQKTVKKQARFREKSEWCEYNIYIPKGFSRNKSYYLVIGMHGYMDSADRFGLLWKELKNKDIIFIVPESPFSLLESTEAVLKWGPLENYSKVYSDEVYQKGETTVVGILKNAKQLFHIKQTWMLGFSQGASFSYLIPFHYPEMFDGIAPLSGWFVQTGMAQEDYDRCKHIKVLISHGTMDPVVLYRQGEEAADTLTKAGLTVQFLPFKGTHIVNHDAVKDMVKWIRS